MKDPFPRRPNDYPDGLMIILVIILSMLAMILTLLIPSSDLRRVDTGGSISLYTQQARTCDGPLPYDCRSACTMYLLNGCVTPAHKLIFHLPTPKRANPSQIGLFARLGGTDYDGALYTPGALILPIVEAYPVNPATGVDWTWADLAGLEVGLRAVT